MNLVSISSPSGMETEIAKFVRDELVRLGFETTIDKGGNVLSRSNGEGEPFLISSHLDTVQGAFNVKPVRTRGVIRSSGDSILGADNKASVAAILNSLRNLPTNKRKNLELIFSTREETDGGVAEIDMSWVKSRIGVSADSGEPIGTIVSDTPFIEGFDIEVNGKSSHSSEPENGINALSIASHSISNFKWGKVDEITTANIGLIDGGSAVNTTPGRIRLQGEIRSYSRENLEKTKQELISTFEKVAELHGGKVSFKFQYYCDGYTHLAKERSLKKIRQVYRKMGIKTVYRKSFGGSDANFFNSHGIRVVDIGDGVNNPHTHEEFITEKDLQKLSDIFTAYITE